MTPVHSPLRTLSANAYTLVEHLVHSAIDVCPSTTRLDRLGRPQRRVQHRPVLGDVDVLAGQHRVSALGQADLVGQIDECTQDVGVDQVLGQVDVEVAGLEGE